MKFKQACFTIITLLIISFLNRSSAQNLSFGAPVNILHSAGTSKAIAIDRFKENYFIAWSDAAGGNIHINYAGKHPLDNLKGRSHTIEGANSAFAPVFCNASNHLYALWIAADGKIHYIVNTNDTSFTGSKVHTLDLGAPAALGLATAVSGDNIIITAHNTNKDGLFYATAAIGAEGILSSSGHKVAPVKSAGYPAIVALSDSTVRLCWRGNKDQDIYYADGNINTNKWEKPKKIFDLQTTASPAMFIDPSANRFFYVARGGKKDDRVYYTSEEDGKRILKTDLPSFFTSRGPVSICKEENNRFLMAYTGIDSKFYLSEFMAYSPAKWMEQTLFPAKANYSLKDIIMPGSHDAGMSVLTAVGGQQKGTINDCNTLTQIRSVKEQLNPGLRMFDIRVGLYKDSIYTKHASSDCMDEAIGGGFGEKFSVILHDLKEFLKTNTKESVIFSFSHFCAKETPIDKVAQVIIDSLGKDHVYANNGKKLNEVTLNELAGKAIMVFEEFATADKLIDSCTIAASSNSFINFKREYAATNSLANLTLKEKAFFTKMAPLKYNDLVRLDWQLTQSHDEAAMVCNSFQDESINPLLSSAMALTSALRSHRSIIDLSKIGNKSVPGLLNEWVANGAINKNNKPNILYVDVAGPWVTDYCVQLNMNAVYTR